jgi:hypothetical protein
MDEREQVGWVNNQLFECGPGDNYGPDGEDHFALHIGKNCMCGKYTWGELLTYHVVEDQVRTIVETH